MSIKCGRCSQRHETVADVRACYNGETVTTVPEPIKGAQYRATANQVGFLSRLLAQTGGHLTSGAALDTLPKRGPGSASELIDGMLRFGKGLGSIPEGITLRPKKTAQREVAPAQVKEAGLSQYDVPNGHYAVTSLTGNNDLDFFRVDRPTEGKWKGYTFIKRVIGGKPDSSVRGVTAKKAMEAIVAATPAKAAQVYGQEIGRCSRCNRHLTDAVSREAGMGPECRSKKS
jgi:hypothetical protein